MKKIPRLLLLALVGFGSIVGASAQTADVAALNATADAYLAAYTAQDLARLATYYTPETEFDDPTSEGYWRERFRMRGGDAIVGAMREGWSLIRAFRFEEKERFAYHDRVVLIGTSHLRMDGAMFGGEAGRDYDVALPAVTILRIVDGKVLLHLDHYDYAPLRALAEAR